MSPDRISSPDIKTGRRKHKSKNSKRKSKTIDNKSSLTENEKDVAEAAAVGGGRVPQVDFVESTVLPPGTANSAATSKGKAGPWRPGLPKLLSKNVFVDPPLQQVSSNPHRKALTRSSSLPDLSRATTIPGRGLRPSHIPPQPPPKPKSTLGTEEPSDEDDEPKAELSRTAAVVMLLVSTGLVALCAEFLVDAIPAMTASNSNVSQAFIGLIILPIVGNAAEHVTAVTVAMKNKMDLAIGVAVGSSIQIALFVTPLVVILGWIMNREMSLYFTIFETISLFVTVFVINFLILDGRSNYLEGTLLIASYVIIAVAAFFYPDNENASEVGGGDPKNTTVNATAAAAQLLVRQFIA